MGEQSEGKWIICRICLKTSEKEMSPIFGTGAIETSLSYQIAEYGLIKLSESNACPNRICEKCLLLLKAAQKFRQLCQRSAKQWKDLLQLSECGTEAKKDKTVIEEILNKTICVKQLNDVPSMEKSLVLHEEQQKEEGDTVDSYVFEVIHDVDEDCNEGGNHLLESNDGEFGELDNDRMAFLEDNSAANSDELTYYSNSQFEVLKHEETLSSDVPINKFFYDEPQAENLHEEKSKRNDHEFEISTKTVSVKSQVTRGRRKISNIKKPSQKNKSRYGGDSSNEWAKKAPSNYICSFCGNVYTEKAKLTLHLRIHTKEKPHECEICHKRFSQTPQLTRHMNSHTGNRPFKCKFCEASFADPSTCIKHQRIHTQERPYVCDTCGKAFSYSNVLKVHVMSHTGEKPYNCKYCGKKFTQAHHRSTHERIHTT
ncbi:PREDICTED: zinc finger protein OZF-like [Rhagoletis zephyria]|uniref:zinc finger protein OZF-like n=1 Tax=Rhagoletis zephyria TaxID=28612 RepID=UPI000811662C|nr:PREDICTED: zinc finger protein OZF-like [Rhagoletis zephyria]